MSIESARTWLVKASLTFTAATFVFFFIAPALNYPLRYDQSFRLLQVVFPVFAAYLGSATYYLFNQSAEGHEAVLPGNSKLLGLLVKGPLIVFAIAMIAAIVAFGSSNRFGAVDEGMSVDTLSLALSLALGLLTVTTNAIAAYIFASPISTTK